MFSFFGQMLFSMCSACAIRCNDKHVS